MLAFLFCLVLACLLYWAVRRFVGKRMLNHVLVFGLLLALICFTLPAASARLTAARGERERQAQRAVIVARITGAGGWSALQKACEEIVDTHSDGRYPHGVFLWSLGSAPELPPALAALRPKEVRFYSPAFLARHGHGGEPVVAVVRIKISGFGDKPYYGLEVVCGAGAEGYVPETSRRKLSNSLYWPNDYGITPPRGRFNKITDRIYEIY